jgi:hypothetical protein
VALQRSQAASLVNVPDDIELHAARNELSSWVRTDIYLWITQFYNVANLCFRGVPAVG